MTKKSKRSPSRAPKRGRKRAGRPRGSSGGANKSQAIRDYLAAHPRAKPQAVAEALVAQGVQVTPAFVSAVKFNAKKKSGRRAKRATTAPAPVMTRGRAAASRDGALTVERLIATKQFVDRVGGVANAHKALEALSRVLG